MTQRTARWLSVLLVVATIAAGLFVLPRMHVVTSITHFLPHAQDKRQSVLMSALAESELGSTQILDLSGDPPDQLVEHAKVLLSEIAAMPETKSVRSGADDAKLENVTAALSERAPMLLSKDAQTDEQLDARLDRLRELIASPLGVVAKRTAPADPLGATYDALDAMKQISGAELQQHSGIVTTLAGDHAFLFLVTKSSAFDVPAQRAIINHIDDCVKKRNLSGLLRLETSGVAKYAVWSEGQIRGDIERIGTISTLGILLFFAFAFRSIRLLLLGMLPLAFGSMLALIVTHFALGQVHGITIAFGTSLLGVGIDYAEHYFVHFAVTNPNERTGVVRRIWPGLWMGALTTVIGLVGLGFTTFPGVREIALFSTVAIVGALIGTVVLLPPWMPASYERPAVLVRASQFAETLIARYASKRSLWWTPLLVTVVALGVASRASFSDDVSLFVSPPAALVAEDHRVQQRMSVYDVGLFVVVAHHDDEDALIALERTTDALDRAKTDGLLRDYPPIGILLHSQHRQRENLGESLRRVPRLREKMTEKGFRPAAFERYWSALTTSAEPMKLDEILVSPMGHAVRQFAPRLAVGRLFVLPLSGVKDVEALRARLPDAVLIDEASLVTSAYKGVRRETLRMLGVGVLLVFLVVALRYRSLRICVAAIFPGVLACVVTVAIFAASGRPLTLLHLVGLMLVLSMGVDYGIFVVEGRTNVRAAAEALVSVLTATITTLLSFGLLALSKNPALAALGFTITLGITLSLLLCPAALVLWAFDRDQKRGARP